MRSSPRLFHQESMVAKSESFDDACDQLFFENASPNNIFHLLFINKKHNSFEEKFKIFIDLLAQGADLNKELAENKNLKSEILSFFELEYDDEEVKYFENKLLFKLKEFKTQLTLLPRLEKIPRSKDLYIKSINYLQKIASFYEKQLRDSTPDLSSVEKFYSKITEIDFFSKKQPEEIEHILSYMGFLSYLKESKFINFLYEKFEQYMKKPDSEMPQEEKNIYNSINILIETLSDCFELRRNQKIHYAQIEEIENDNSAQYLALRNKFLMSVKAIIEDQISKREEKKEVKKKDDLLKKTKEKERIKIEEKKELERERLKGEKKAEKLRKKEEQKMLKQFEEEAKKEAEEKIKREAEEKAKKKAEEKDNKDVEARAKKEEKERRRQAFLEAEKLRQELAEKTKIEEEKLRKELAENAKRQAEEQAKQQEIEKQIKQQQIEEIKDRILEKTSANFEKFQLFFDFLREKNWLDIGEMGLFGSRIYKEVINETCPSLKIPENPQADFDFFCIPDKEKSSGIFAFCHEESASKENFQEIIEEFNAKNPNLQISFLEEENGKKSVNFNRHKKSLNFKLVATFYEDKFDGEKTEKTAKEKVEFDLNFYTQQSMLENLQWQFNLERVMLSQVSDGSFQLKINQSNCDPSEEKMTVEKFITEAQNSEQQDFLFEANPQARGFLNRIINAKGVYKYLDEETLDAIKIKLLTNTEIKENLKNELLNYKNLADRDVSEPRNSSEIQEKIEQAKLIIEKVKVDKIFKEDKDFQEILQRSPKNTPTQASVRQESKERF